MKCLIVDDEPLALIRLQKMLESEGINNIITATNGKEAIELVESHHPKVVFLDVEMPVMKGTEAAYKIKAISSETEIIFCTAYDDFALQAFDLSVSDYLLKPVTKGRLQQALQKISQLSQTMPSISFPIGRDILSLSFEDVYCFISEDKCTFMYCLSGEVIVDESLVILEQKYKNQLLRINRNALVNRNEICGIHKDSDKNAFVKLRSTDYQPQISRRNLVKIKEYLK